MAHGSRKQLLMFSISWQGPPEKNGVRADCIIARPGTSNGLADPQSHLEVVTFDPAQVYPEFIVRFQEQWMHSSKASFAPCLSSGALHRF